MSPRGGAWWRLLALLPGIALSCHAKDLGNRIFSCKAGHDETCGTAADDRPMTCFSIESLGGSAFCTDTCTDADDPEKTVCVNGIARLRRCRPTEGKQNSAYTCPEGLQCYRTDLLRDEGVCMVVPVCSVNKDCTDPARPTCASTLISDYYPGRTFQSDGLHCLQATCKKSQSDCASGEVCLAAVIPTVVAVVPDMCSPYCDGNQNCPPNFVCLTKVSGAAPFPICLPAIVGYKCTTALDCLLGECVATGAGFNLCSTPCRSDQDCIPLNEPSSSFVCIADQDGSGRHCISPTSLAGAMCQKTEDCLPDETCFHYNPYRSLPYGECRLPCSDDGGCAARVGIPHVCLKGGEGGCFPTRFGLPCIDSTECISGFECHAVSGGFRAPPGSLVCTMACTTDADCDANPWTDQDGYCQDGYCQLGFGPGDPCERNAHCRSRNCMADFSDTTGALKCQDEPL